MEGLYQYSRTSFINESVSDLAQKYISVQYNAVRDLAGYTVARFDQPVYGPSWNGSAKNTSDYDQAGEVAASELFVTALGTGLGPGPVSR